MLTTIYRLSCSFFFFNDTATTEIYTLSLHDALPICDLLRQNDIALDGGLLVFSSYALRHRQDRVADRKSTRLNSSHVAISYAVFCLKKKKKIDFEINKTTKTHKKTTI